MVIPRNEDPQTLGDLQSIALCNVLCNIVSKSMANRLKHVLPQVISESQNVIVLDRDDIKLALELYSLKA